jgi:gas vesicle protein
MTNNTTERFIAGALLGGLVGVTLTLLVTPVPGSQLRKQVQNGLNILNGKRKTALKRRKVQRAHSKRARAHAKQV